MSASPHDEPSPPDSAIEASADEGFIPVRWRHRLVVILIYLALIGLGLIIARQFEELSSMELGPTSDPMVRQLIIIAALLFVLTSALPFVPGAEIGFGLLLLFGAPLAPLVYVCMVAALVLAFAAGRMLPRSSLAALFRYIRFNRAAHLMDQLKGKSPRERLNLLTEQAPTRFLPLLLKHRYLAIILAFNVPGNTIVGGGGGIALVAGMSGLFTFGRFLAAVAVAIAPVPLFFFLMG